MTFLAGYLAVMFVLLVLRALSGPYTPPWTHLLVAWALLAYVGLLLYLGCLLAVWVAG